jgi:malyl-CoA/(S)-citramalyl-CoA lyase
VDLVEAVGNRVDMILVPKVGRPADLEFVELLLSQIEQAYGYDPIPLTALIETAPGMANVEAIAQACPTRLEALVFGVGDYIASTRARTTVIGGVTQEYAVLTDADESGERAMHWGDPWHFALSRMLVACRANGLRPIDGPFGDFSDPDGYRMSCRRAAALGYDGKWAIHPSQIQIANEVFSPLPEEVDRARRIIIAMAEAAAEGRGAVSLDGRLIDAASIKMAENVVARADMIAGA